MEIKRFIDRLLAGKVLTVKSKSFPRNKQARHRSATISRALRKTLPDSDFLQMNVVYFL